MNPIAIIGLGVRLPGGIVDRASARQLFEAGSIAIGEVPPDRWDASAVERSVSGHPVPRAGGFLPDIDQFDPDPFGISPREAHSLDPQQRLLLELAWEGLEDAGIGPTQAEGSSTGVYVGMGMVDWARRTVQSDDPERIDAWSGTGAFESVAAGRVSYALGLRGPAMAVQTACSSSLVAIHLAIQALCAADCEIAIAGGVSLMLEPQATQYFAELQALSPTGTCRAFDDAANGYVRGEGGALFVLKPLERAAHDGDRILGVIRGSAVNQDGRATRLTAPSGRAQRDVIEAALRAAELEPGDVTYVEAHGTGTPLGDAVELDALAEAYGAERRLWVGSGKSQLGHLEPAAGAAALVRALSVLGAHNIPAQPGFQRLTVRARVGDRVGVPTRSVPWPPGPRHVGISAFGLSGTNAHLVVEGPPERPAHEEGVDAPVLFAIGAHDAGGLADRYEQVQALLDRGEPLAGVARGAAEGRAQHRVRAAVVVHTRDELPRTLPAGKVRRSPPVLGFLFAGHGSQYPAMGHQLWEGEPAYRDAVVEVDAHFRAHTGASLLEVLHGAEAEVMRRPQWAQPALFALEWGLAALWRSWGVLPDAVIGHSAGELAAAAVAGVVALPDAVIMAAERGRLLQEHLPAGRMIAVAHDADAVASLLEAWPDVSIAAINAPDEVVISGAPERILEIQPVLEKLDVRVTDLDVTVPFHSPHARAAAQAFHDVVAKVPLHAPQVAFYSCVTGGRVEPEVTAARYWSQQLVEQVRFADAVLSAADAGVDTFLELSARRVLAAAGTRVVPDATWLGGLHPGKDDVLRCLEALSQLFVRGRAMDLRAVMHRAPWTDLPPYPFQRSRYWLAPTPAAQSRRVADVLPRYRLSWEPRPARRGSVSGQRWIVLGNPERIGGIIQRMLHEAGAEAHCTPALPDDGEHRVIWFVEGEPSGRPAAAVKQVLGRLAALLRDHRVSHLWVIVRAGQSDVFASAVAGFGVTAALEAPARWGGMLRVSPGVPSRAAADAIVASVTSADDEDVVVIGKAGRSVPRLTTVVTPPTAAPQLDPEARYLVSGGLGALGLAVAGLLVDLGARHLVLLSRSGAPAEADHPTSVVLTALRDRGARIATPAVDVSDNAAVRGALMASRRPVRGIVHAAGVAAPTEIAHLDAESLGAPLSAKIDGAHVLAKQTDDQPLDFLVFVSSVAALWGAQRLAVYGAANRAMHALARERRREGKPGVALVLGPLAAGGLVRSEDLQAFRRMGVHSMPTEEVLHAVASVLRPDTEPEVVVAEVSWDVFVPVLESRRPRPLLHRVHEPGSGGSVAGGQLAYEVQQAPADQRRNLVVRRVASETCAVLGRSDPIGPRQSLADLGLDSVMAVELAERLRTATGLPLAPTVALEHNTVHDLATHLLSGLGVGTSDARDAVVAAIDEPIAIVGLACRVPGAADLDEFWNLLVDGAGSIGPVPRDRWDPETDERLPTTGSFLSDVDQFDPAAFGLTAEAAARIDPQHRLLLELAEEALQRAGIAPDSLAEQRGGVFVAVGSTDYPGSGLGTEPSFAAGRLAGHLHLRGPSLAVNAGASGSLVAVHLACHALQHAEATIALAGGAQTRLTPASGRGWQEEGALSRSGVCRVFDEHADGVVAGEGAALVVLKRLRDAERDGDSVLAVIKGSAVGGGAASVLAQEGGAQQEVLRRALRDARVRAPEVGVVEANAAGTPVADAVEVEAMKAVYARGRDEALRVTSAKPQIGHLGAAAGVVGLVKMVLALRHRRVPGIRALDTLNPALPVDFPVHFPRHAEPWPQGGRLGAVHAFGMAGTQAALVLAGPPEHLHEPLPSPGAHLLLLSAPDRSALGGVQRDVRAALKRFPVPDVASMLAHGRRAGRVRLAAVGLDPDRLRRWLQHPDAEGNEPSSPPRIGFLFGGVDDVTPGVAAEFAMSDATFAGLLQRAVAAVPTELCKPVELSAYLLDARSPESASMVEPAAVALGWALAERWSALGVRPAAVVGHGVGEIAAAAAAGVLSLEQAMHLAVVRSDAESVRWDLVTGAPWSEVEAHLEEQVELRLEAVDASDRIVVTGPREVLREVGQALRAAGWPAEAPVAVVGGVTSPDAVRRAAQSMETRPPRTVLVTTVDGEPVNEMGPDHWVRHAQEAVRFRDAVRSVAERCDGFVELAARPRLIDLVQGVAPSHATWPTLDPPRPSRVRMLQTAGDLWMAGVDLQPDGVLGRRAPIALPPVPFTRTRCWSVPLVSAGPAAAPAYEVTWHAVPPAEHPVDGRVLLIEEPHGAFGIPLVERWTAEGRRASRILLGDPLDVADVVLTVLLDGPSAVRALRAVASQPGVRPRVWWVTRGAVAVRPDEPADARQAALWGLAAAALLEHPEVFAGIVDLDPEADADGLLDAIAVGAPRMALRGDVVFTPRLTSRGVADDPAQWVRDDAQYLVSGSGPLVGALVRRLLAHGAGRVWSIGPTEPDPGELHEPESARWTWLEADLQSRAEVKRHLGRIRADAEGLAGVYVIAPSISEDARLVDADLEAWESSWREGLAPVLPLHELTDDLEQFVVITEAVSWLGAAGNGLAGTISASLDALVQHRVARGRSGTAVLLGPLEAGGPWSEDGLRAMSADSVLDLLPRVGPGRSGVFLVEADWDEVARRHRGAVPELLRGLPGVPERTAMPGEASSLVHRLRELRPLERAELLRKVVYDQAAALLGHVDGELGLRQGLVDAGMDAGLVTELARRLGRLLDLPLAPADVFEHGTVVGLADALLETLGLVPRVARPSADELPADVPIAIVAMGCRYPGDVSSPEALWALLQSGHTAIGEIPPERWDVDAWYVPPPAPPGKMYVRSGGFLADVDLFDPEFFDLSPREAAALDPQQRLLLEVSWEALERGGMATRDLRGSRIGVFVGIADRGYQLRSRRPVDRFSASGGDAGFGATRIAHTFGLTGPAVGLDSHGSASLLAVHQAARALAAGDCDAALAGGVSLMLRPEDTAAQCALGALSVSGRSLPFDVGADGAVPGEGCGVVVLKRLEDAERDGSAVLAVIRGAAVAHDGASAGLLAPSGHGQQQVLREALARADARPWEVGVLEAHGGATRVGDAVEVRAAEAVLGDRRDRGPVLLGSIKAHLGHAEQAAGVASLIKGVLMMGHRVVPPQPLRELNPSFALEHLAVPDREVPIPPGTRFAMVAAYGMSGSNVALVLGEGHGTPVAPSTRTDRPLHILALSARSEAALHAWVDRMRVPLGRSGLPELAASVHRRRAFEVRGVVVAADAQEALGRLAAIRPARVRQVPRVGLIEGAVPEGALDRLVEVWPFDDRPAEAFAAVAELLERWGVAHREDGPHDVVVVVGQGGPDDAVPALGGPGDDPASGLIRAVAELFERGSDVDWVAWDAPWPRPVVAVPTTPFDRRRFWLEEGRQVDWTYGIRWVEPPSNGDLPRAVVLIGPGAAGQVARLRAGGIAATVASVDTVRPGSFVIDLRWVESPSASAAVWGLLSLAQRLEGGTVCVVTRRGCAIGEETVDPSASALWGAARSLLASGGSARVFDTEPHGLLAALQTGEPEVAVRGDQAFVPRLERVALPIAAPALAGRWWITGGLGVVGTAVAEWLADAGVRELVLPARKPGDLPEAVLERLRARGVEVRPIEVSVTDEPGMQDLLRRYPPEGVVHAARVVVRHDLAHVRAPDVVRALEAHAEGARVLDGLLADHALQGLVFFSSLAGTLGRADAVAWAASAAMVDGIARRRSARGLPALSVAWGPWAGDAAGRGGVRPVPIAAALEALGAAMASGVPWLVVARIDWDRFEGWRPLVEGFVAEPERILPDDEPRLRSLVDTGPMRGMPIGGWIVVGVALGMLLGALASWLLG